MGRGRGVDTREHHVELGCHHVVLLIAGEHVFVALALVFLDFARIERLAFVYHGIGALAPHFIERARIERLAVEKRTVAVLLAVEVGTEGKHVFGRVLVHGGVGRRADENQRVARIAYEDHECAQSHQCEYAHTHLPYSCHIGGYEERYRNPQVAADECQTRKEQRQEQRYAYAARRALCVELMDGPDEYSHGEYGVDEDAHVEAHVEGVDAETLHILRRLYEAGHESVENHGHNGEGDEQRYQGAFHVGVAPFAVVDHQHYGGDAQQVEQMDGY